MIQAISREVELQREYLTEPVETIYFGGGTPSLLTIRELDLLLETCRKNFNVTKNAEVTLEANPDDLDISKLKGLLQTGINRLSIGIQSFDDQVLKGLNRAHNAAMAEQSVKISQDIGISNISIDLIYALPDLTMEAWQQNVEKAIGLTPAHISAYSLTIEEKTVLGKWAAKGKVKPPSDDEAANHLTLLITLLEAAGFEQYEISNFAQPDRYSRHNSSYWRQTPYLGIGPSAHSYNVSTRQFNINNNHQYLKNIKTDKVPATIEELTREDNINDYLLTTLRTSWGTDLKKLRAMYDFDLVASNSDYIHSLLDRSLAKIEDSKLVLTKAGRFLADKISSDLFVIAKD